MKPVPVHKGLLVLAEGLQRDNEELAGRVDELADVNRAQAFHHEARNRFTSSAAHELNSALTPLALELHILRRGGLDALDPRQRRAVEALDRSAQRLALLARDLLDASRLQSGKFRVHPRVLALGDVISEVAESLAAKAQEGGVELTVAVEPGLVVRADPTRVHQVLLNLLANALRLTPGGGWVVVAATAHDGMARVEVRDTGAGIAAEDLPRVFQPFLQLHHGHAGQGSGLGLSICKGLVEQHGGAMGCASAGPGQGAAFWFTLPREPAAAQPQAPPRTPAIPDGGLTDRAGP